MPPQKRNDRNGKISAAQSTVSNEAAKAYDISWPPIGSNTADGRSPVNEYQDHRLSNRKQSKWEVVFNKKNQNIEIKQQQMKDTLFKQFKKEKS